MASIRRTYILTMALKMTVTNAKVRCSTSTNAREICCEETEKEWPKKSVELQREIMLLRTPINKTVITLGPFPLASRKSLVIWASAVTSDENLGTSPTKIVNTSG